MLKARTERKRASASPGPKPAQRRAGPPRTLAKLRRELGTITQRIQSAEARVREIEGLFCEPDYFTRTPADEVRAREAERKALHEEIAELMPTWEGLEHDVAALEGQA